MGKSETFVNTARQVMMCRNKKKKVKRKGCFLALPATDWVDENGNPHPRKMILLRNVCYVDSKGRVWHIPMRKPDGKPQVVDGSSIPRLVWWIIGSPFVGLHRYASVVHDVGCEKQEQWADWKTIHWLYWDAHIAVGAWKVTAFVRWLAVRLFGPRWKFDRGEHVVR